MSTMSIILSLWLVGAAWCIAADVREKTFARNMPEHWSWWCALGVLDTLLWWGRAASCLVGDSEWWPRRKA